MKYVLKTKTATYYYKGRIKDSGLFDMIERLAGAVEAIEATSWAEIADYSETYENELFTLTIEE